MNFIYKFYTNQRQLNFLIIHIIPIAPHIHIHTTLKTYK